MPLVVNYNVKQVTNYDTIGKPTRDFEIEIQTRKGIEKRTITYVNILSDVEIIKFGYCCETLGHNYPIFLEVNNKYKQFFAGKEGMYEVQPEDWVEEVDSEPLNRIAQVVVTGVMVPKDIEFTFDYVIPFN